MRCYWTGAAITDKPQRVIVVFSDVYGMDTGNHKHFCDRLASKLNQATNNNNKSSTTTTTAVIMPDLFRGNPILQPWFQNLGLSEYRGSVLGAPSMLLRLKFNHPPAVLERDICQIILPWLQSVLLHNSQSYQLACVGFCFGGWCVGRALALPHTPFVAGVGIHPSFQPELLHSSTPEALAKRISKQSPHNHNHHSDNNHNTIPPLLLLPARNDDGLLADSAVVQLLAAARHVPVHQVAVEFPTMRHGWVTRGDGAADPRELAQEQERALQVTADFLQRHVVPDSSSSSSSNSNGHHQLSCGL